MTAFRSSAVTARIAAALAIGMMASCGGGDGTTGDGPDSNDGGMDAPSPETCGNDSCDLGETCTNCARDCGCPAGQTCSGGSCRTDDTPRCGDGTCQAERSENCMSCAEDCGCGTEQRCYRPENGDPTCVSANPLIETIPGRWREVERNGEPVNACCTSVAVDPTQPSCTDPDQVPGDACVTGFEPYPLVLAGTRVFAGAPSTNVDGQVLNEGTRVEYTCTSDYCAANNINALAYQKEP